MGFNGVSYLIFIVGTALRISNDLFKSVRTVSRSRLFGSLTSLFSIDFIKELYLNLVIEVTLHDIFFLFEYFSPIDRCSNLDFFVKEIFL